MNLLFDTNILLTMLRAKDYTGIVRFLNPDNVSIYVSVASEAELKSIALQNNWGNNRIIRLEDLLEQLIIVEINQLNINPYAEIESYSQRKNDKFTDYPFSTPRNMGKNDLWIASLTALLGLQLVTTDSDFDHLQPVFFDVRKIEPQAFVPFF